MLVATIVLALYAWAYTTGTQDSATLLVSSGAAMMSGIAFVIGFIFYLWTPKKYIFWGSYSAFAVLCIMSATLIVNTGGTSSPFIALWMIVSVFAGIFGLYGLLPLFITLTAYLLFQYSSGLLSREAILTVVLAGELPLAVSYLIWHTKTKTDTPSDRAYQKLATELDQVASQSDVVINAIADGVIALDSQGTIQLINPAAQQIIGWGKQDALALDYKSVLKLVDKNDNELTPANDPVSQVLATNQEVTTDDLHLITNSGKKLLVSVVVSPVSQLGAGVIIVFRDITKEKAEEREQAEFISTASHEMRTPVASIEGYLGLALNPTTAQIDDKAREFIAKAHESAQHLGRLFQDLLDVSKAEDGRLANNPKVVDVVAFTHDIVQGLKPHAVEKGLHIVFKPLPDEEEDKEKGSEKRLNPVLYINVDTDHLREVISNLVENAIKYTPKGEVIIDVTGDDEHVTINVADSGIGIPKEDIGHLFQKFYRVDNSDTREIGGTGLGLYLCRRLTEAMNGRIWVESEYKQGSTFYVELPRIDHEEAMRLIDAANLQSTSVASEQQFQTPSYQGITLASPQPYSRPTPPPIVPTDTTYTSAPAETVAEQLQSMQYPAPANPPAPPTPAPAAQPQSSNTQRANVPLSSIEQNPTQYLRSRSNSVPIPRARPK